MNNGTDTCARRAIKCFTGEEQKVYDTLREFNLIDSEGFYTVYETKRPGLKTEPDEMTRLYMEGRV